MDFPALWTPPGHVTLWTGSEECCGAELAAYNTAPSSAVLGVTNLAFFLPVEVQARLTAVKMFALNGAAVAGHVDLGIYDDQANRLVSIGSTLQAGTNANQEFDITDTVLLPGVYYMALSVENAAAAFFEYAISAGNLRTFGVLAQSLGSVTLPNPATFAAIANGILPIFGLTARTVV